MRFFKSTFAAIALVGALGFGTAAFAVGLDGAKAQGLIGEQQNGYVGIVTPNPAPDLKALVNDVNLRRRSAYNAVAAQTPGATLGAVEKLAAAKLIAKTPSNQIVQDSSGNWVKKP